MTRTLLATAALAAIAGPAAACSLAIAFGFDVSTSMDKDERALVREGVRAAMTDPEVATLVAMNGGVMMLTYIWGENANRVQADWRMVYGADDLAVLADETLGDGWPSGARTNLFDGVAFGLAALADAPCAQRKLDIAGDGPPNVTSDIDRDDVRRYADEIGVQINGLPIYSDNRASSQILLPGYYADNVQWGFGSFVEPAASFAAFGEAFRRKLMRELSVMVSDAGAAQ